jgi:hypothetical protein
MQHDFLRIELLVFLPNGSVYPTLFQQSKFSLIRTEESVLREVFRSGCYKQSNQSYALDPDGT